MTSRGRRCRLTPPPDLVVLAAVVAVACVGALRLVSLPEATFTATVVIDDAFYYLMPAVHLRAGAGYAFTSGIRSNGIQPLWGLITVALVYLVPDRLLLPRVLVLLSGVLWIAAGVVLHLALRPMRRDVAALASTGFILTGFWNRLAFQGMENGLHALLFAGILLAGVRHLRAPSAPGPAGGRDPGRRFAGVLGILAALLTLTRVESVLLLAMLGLALGLGAFGTCGAPGESAADDRSRWGPQWPCLIRFAVPAVALLGAWSLFSLRYFGRVSPISGDVKRWYESVWPSPFHGPVAALAWHARYLSGIALHPASKGLDAGAWRVLHRGVAGLWLGGGLAVMAAGGLAASGARVLRLRQPPTGIGVFSAVIALFVVTHAAAFALLLPHFTPYGTWYFAPELVALWVAVAAGVSLLAAPGSHRAARRWGRPLPVAVAVLILLGNAPLVLAPPSGGSRGNAFAEAGRWMQAHLPAGQDVGTKSSGYVAWFAPSHRVHNLDGLMNDDAYLRDVLSRGRVPDYLRREGIAWFADYAPVEVWRQGYDWPTDLPLEGMRLVKWWWMNDEEDAAALGYGIWALLPEGQRRDLLGPCEAVCDRVDQLQFAAGVLGRFPVVPEEQLQRALRERPGSRVVTSYAPPPSRRLRHVLVPPERLDEARFTPGEVDIPQRVGVRFDGVELLGVDLDPEAPGSPLTPGGRLVLTRYWRVSGGPTVPARVFETFLLPDETISEGSGPTLPRSIGRSPGCHGTCPVETWKPGEVIVETESLPLPIDLLPGRYTILIGVRDGAGSWVRPEEATEADRPLVPVGAARLVSR